DGPVERDVVLAGAELAGREDAGASREGTVRAEHCMEVRRAGAGRTCGADGTGRAGRAGGPGRTGRAGETPGARRAARACGDLTGLEVGPQQRAVLDLEGRDRIAGQLYARH